MAAKKMWEVWDSGSASLRREPSPRQHILVVDGDGDIRRLNTEVLICHESGIQLTLPPARTCAMAETYGVNT
jgi:hypothetical protein